MAVLEIISLCICRIDGCYNRRCGALSRLVRATGKTLYDVWSPRLAVECNSAAGDRPTKSPATFKSLSKLSKAVWSIYAITLSLGLYSSLLFFFSSIRPRHLCN